MSFRKGASEVIMAAITSVLNRFSSVSLRDGLQLGNRVFIPAMASETSDEFGTPTEATFSHYEQLAKARVGAIIVEYSYVHPSGRSEPQQLGAYQDSQIEGLSRIAEIINTSRAISLLQLTHSGGKSSRDLSGGRLFAPSAVPVPVKDREMETPEEMSKEDIELWKTSFLNAAHRAHKAGFAGIELHSAHGYGLNQWLSPITNQRTDEYGGTLENRAKLLLEVVGLIREQVPQLLISVRIPGQDFLPGGLVSSEMQAVAKWLQDAGVDFINVSSGIGGWRRPGNRDGEGYLVHEARLIQSAVQIPVIGVGGIKTGEYIDQVIGDGSISFAAVGRALLENPIKFNRDILCR
jgi:NADPH2 dehydrogenase